MKLSVIGVIGANLVKIGGGKGAGSVKISKKVNGFKEFLLVNQSVTGFYENCIDLLKV